MAIVTVKSGPITNRDATPSVKNNPAIDGGVVRGACATVEVTTGDSSTSKYILCQLPSNARVKSLKIFSDDLGTATAADFGLYRNSADGGSVVDADFFKAAQSLNAGALNGTEIANAATPTNADDVEKMVWQQLGLSSDPCVVYDVVATLTADSDTGGTLSIDLMYQS